MAICHKDRFSLQSELIDRSVNVDMNPTEPSLPVQGQTLGPRGELQQELTRAPERGLRQGAQPQSGKCSGEQRWPEAKAVWQ